MHDRTQLKLYTVYGQDEHMYRNTFCAFPRVYCTAREPWPQFMQVADATHAWAHCGRKKLLFASSCLEGPGRNSTLVR